MHQFVHFIVPGSVQKNSRITNAFLIIHAHCTSKFSKIRVWSQINSVSNRAMQSTCGLFHWRRSVAHLWQTSPTSWSCTVCAQDEKLSNALESFAQYPRDSALLSDLLSIEPTAKQRPKYATAHRISKYMIMWRKKAVLFGRVMSFSLESSFFSTSIALCPIDINENTAFNIDAISKKFVLSTSFEEKQLHR